MTGTMREPFDMFEPEVGFQFANGVVPAFNYAKIIDVNKYYFINDWYYSEGIWWAGMEEDTLATFKTDIGLSNQYVLRSSVANNTFLMDTLYPTGNIVSNTYGSSDTSIITSYPESTWHTTMSGGWYVVGMLNSDASAVGGVCYYVMTQAQFQNFRHYLMDDPAYMGTITDVTQNLLKALVNPLQYIVSIKWFPCEPPHEDDTVNLYLGWWSTNLPAYRLTNSPTTFFQFAATIPDHPQSSTRGIYLNLNPYTTAAVNIPTVGQIPIDMSKLLHTRSVSGALQIDFITGSSAIHLQSAVWYDSGVGKYSDFGWFYGEAGVNIQLAQMSGTVGSGVVNSVVEGANKISPYLSGSSADNAVNQGLSLAACAVKSTIESAFPQVSSTGGNGSFLKVKEPTRLMVTHSYLADEDNADKGRPLCSNRTVSALGGFMLCADVHPDFLLATYREKESIKELMESGFFYE